MAPLMDDSNGDTNDHSSISVPRFVVIGAGSRGNAYARATQDSGLGIVTTVVEPIKFKRESFGLTYIWHRSQPAPGQTFESYRDFVDYERERQKDESDGRAVDAGPDGVFVCVRDEMHTEVVTALAPLGLHIMCEKPLATTLKDCLKIQQCIDQYPQRVFAIGHVLRYSPHNMLLRDLVRERRVIGDIVAIEHTEPVGWWHFSHSYVRGNWRKESFTAPSLLTKSCHDIDWIMWMLCSPLADRRLPPHLPSYVASTGSLKQFRRRNKPVGAGSVTNCLSCPLVDSCMYSAPRIYNDRHLEKGNARWPVDIVNPEVPGILASQGPEQAKKALMSALVEDYDAAQTPVRDIETRPWFGRCVWESDNDVCDVQHVTIEWEDDDHGRGAKTASFQMIAQTLAQCERRGRIYGTSGEISYNSKEIVVHDFEDDSTRTYHPEVPKNSHHGGGDDGLTQQFIKAVAAVKNASMDVRKAQVDYLGVTLEEVIRSHAVVFAAEEARREKEIVDWHAWWATNVGSELDGKG